MRLALPVLVAVTPPAPTVGGRDEIAVPLNPASSQPTVPQMPAGGRDIDQPVQPPLSGVLSLLPPLDLAGLERGLRQFVAQLEFTGQSLLKPVQRGEFWPWIVAAAAALAACEIARREFRSPEFRGPSIDFSDY